MSSFWGKKPKDGEHKAHDGAAPQTLADIARGMQHAVNSTQHLVESHYARMLERYFEDGPEGQKGKGKAITKVILLPNGKQELEIPLISLIPPAGLQLDELEVEMSVRIDGVERKQVDPVNDPTHPEVTRTSFQISFAHRVQGAEERNTSTVDIRMKFKAGDPPEAVSRILEQFTNSILPRLIEKLPAP